MAEKTAASQPQQKTAAIPSFDAAFGLDAWRKMVEDNMTRMTSISDELARVEGKGAEQAKKAIDEGAKLMRESMEYGLQLSAEWRKLTLEATRKAAEMMRPQA